MFDMVNQRSMMVDKKRYQTITSITTGRIPQKSLVLPPFKNLSSSGWGIPLCRIPLMGPTLNWGYKSSQRVTDTWDGGVDHPSQAVRMFIHPVLGGNDIYKWPIHIYWEHTLTFFVGVFCTLSWSSSIPTFPRVMEPPSLQAFARDAMWWAASSQIWVVSCVSFWWCPSQWRRGGSVGARSMGNDINVESLNLSSQMGVEDGWITSFSLGRHTPVDCLASAIALLLVQTLTTGKSMTNHCCRSVSSIHQLLVQL